MDGYVTVIGGTNIDIAATLTPDFGNASPKILFEVE